MKQGLSERWRRWIVDVRIAYKRVFDTTNRDGDRVLGDLAAFCNAYGSTYHQDAREHARMEGRKEVWLRIQAHLQMDEAELLSLYRFREDSKPVPTPEDNTI